jgi:hypothetical protein
MWQFGEMYGKIVGEASRLPQEKRTILNILPSVALQNPHHPQKTKTFPTGVPKKSGTPRGKGSW